MVHVRVGQRRRGARLGGRGDDDPNRATPRYPPSPTRSRRSTHESRPARGMRTGLVDQKRSRPYCHRHCVLYRRAHVPRLKARRSGLTFGPPEPSSARFPSSSGPFGPPRPHGFLSTTGPAAAPVGGADLRRSQGMANGSGYGWALEAGFNAALAAISAKFFATLVPRYQPTASSLSTARPSYTIRDSFLVSASELRASK